VYCAAGEEKVNKGKGVGQPTSQQANTLADHWKVELLQVAALKSNCTGDGDLP
jgi:hypothetical protein